MRVDRVKAGEDHRLDVLKAGQLRGGGARLFGDRVADLGVAHVLDGGGKEADLARGEQPDLDGLGMSTPIDSTSNDLPFDISRMRWPLRMVPCITRTSTITPR